jgi:hypothetical protein
MTPISLGPAILADRIGADARQVRIGQGGFFRPGGEYAIVAELQQRLRVGLGPRKAGERFGAALALSGPGADGLERDHR